MVVAQLAERTLPKPESAVRIQENLHRPIICLLPIGENKGKRGWEWSLLNLLVSVETQCQTYSPELVSRDYLKEDQNKLKVFVSVADLFNIFYLFGIL